MDKTESKYFKTAARMDAAFWELLERKGFAYITVKEICEKAGVNRSTFCLRYETVAGLLAESLEYMTEQFLSYFTQSARSVVERLHTCPLEELRLVTPEYLTPHLRYIREHRRVFQAAAKNPTAMGVDDAYEKLFRQVFTPVLERYRVPEGDRKYLMAFYIRGLFAIIEEWLERDCAEPIGRIISVIEQCIPRPGEVS